MTTFYSGKEGKITKYFILLDILLNTLHRIQLIVKGHGKLVSNNMRQIITPFV
jgi:hypothetical protein